MEIMSMSFMYYFSDWHQFVWTPRFTNADSGKLYLIIS